MRWLRDNFCGDEVKVAAEKGVDPYEVMCDEAAKLPIGSDGVVFLPYLMGERAPHPGPKLSQNILRAVIHAQPLAHDTLGA
jgi:sugar (pentulose or hexulose) kinase